MSTTPAPEPVASTSASTAEAYAPILPGASLCIAYQLTASPVLLVGGGVVAAGRLSALLAAGAVVTIISPSKGLTSEVEYRIAEHPTQIIYHDRDYKDESDLTVPEDRGGGPYKMVLTAIDDPDVSASIGHACRRMGVPVNVADVPPLCDFYFGSIVRRRGLQILISTGGKGPRIANRIKGIIERAIPEEAGDAIENVGELRKGLRKRVPGGSTATIARRMGWMIDVCDKWSLKELALLDKDMMASVLDGYESGKAKTYKEASGKRVWWSPRCPWQKGPDASSGSQLAAHMHLSAGFLLGLATAGAVLAVRAYGTSRRT